MNKHEARRSVKKTAARAKPSTRSRKLGGEPIQRSEGYALAASAEETEQFLNDLKAANITVSEDIDNDYNSWLG